jgi:bacteriorhodopsin
VGVFGDGTDTALFVLLPIFSKVGWSIVDLGRLRALSRDDRLEVA